jgi:hypothetical protein
MGRITEKETMRRESARERKRERKERGEPS